MDDYYDIFISYRHKGGKQIAKRLFKWLSEDGGYSTFYDEASLREGRWDHALLKYVKRCRDFLLIVDRHIFDNMSDASYSLENDWVRKELSEALKLGEDAINVIPIILPKAKLPSSLPDDISEVAKWQWMEIETAYDFQDRLKDLKVRLHSKPTHLQSEFINPIIKIPNEKVNANELIQRFMDFAVNGLLSNIEMSQSESQTQIRMTFK